ncbi:GNAT family N-acetyltransferase, partial [Mycobacterium tuberculosis]
MAQRQDGGKGAKDYQREDLNPEFFAACSRHLHGRSRLWLFRYQGTPIAFFLNVWGADENYILLEWGIDRDFEHYWKANLAPGGADAQPK